MKIITNHKTHQTLNITRAELRRLIRGGKWAAFIANFKEMRAEGYTVVINRVA